MFWWALRGLMVVVALAMAMCTLIKGMLTPCHGFVTRLLLPCRKTVACKHPSRVLRQAGNLDVLKHYLLAARYEQLFIQF